MRAIALCLLLCACASAPTEPRIEIREVKVPVFQPCQVQIGIDPTYPDNKAATVAAPNIFVRTQQIVAGRKMRDARIKELQAALKACVGP